MPTPKHGTACILDGNNRISLPDVIFIHLEGYVAVACIIVFDIGNQIQSILPYKFSPGRNATGILGNVRISDTITDMIDESTQDVGARVGGYISRSVSNTVFDGISIYKRERILPRSADNIAVGGIFICRATVSLVGKVV